MPGSWLVVGSGGCSRVLRRSGQPGDDIAKRATWICARAPGNPARRTSVGSWGCVGRRRRLIDVLKGLVPTLLALWLTDRFTAYVVGLSCVLGHVLSPFLRGRGGKGVATSMGAVLALYAPWFSLGVILVFGLMLWRTRWVAGSSLVAAGLLGLYAGLAPLPEPVVAGRLWGLCIALLVIARHHGNIRRWVRPDPA